MITFSDGGSEHTVRELWRGYNIMNAIDNLTEAWQEVKTSTMNGAWRKIYPECIAIFPGSEEPIRNAHQEIAGLAH